VGIIPSPAHWAAPLGPRDAVGWEQSRAGDSLMPANLTPDYRAAEAAFRQARDPAQRLECLREMLRVIPKHKGTDHLQGDIKRRIKELS